MKLSALAALATASLATAATPAGFQPATQNQLFVQFGNLAALNGAVVAQPSTQVQPTLATQQRLQGQHLVLMVDLDIPPQNGSGPTRTLLHWLQTGLVSAQQPTTLNSTINAGSQTQAQGFILQNTQNTAPLQQYFGPNPPAQNPLSHRYTLLLVDHTRITQQGLSALTQAARTGLGFNAQTVLQQAGLANNVVAGNFFNVTNSGNVQRPVNATGTPVNTGISPTATNVRSTLTPLPNPGFSNPVVAGAEVSRVGFVVLALGLATAGFAML